MGLSLVRHQPELDGIIAPDGDEGFFEAFEGTAPVRASIETKRAPLRLAQAVRSTLLA
jgi:hypothetical protein